MPLPRAVPVTLTNAERKTLTTRAHGAKTAYRDRLRARIVLAAARGRDNARIAADLRITVDTARKWRGRFAGRGLDGLADLPAAHPFGQFQHPTAGSQLELDILAYGRGGLVARVLAEQPDAINLNGVNVRRVVMVGTPNSGTVLTDFERMGDLVDLVTNLLDLVPDVGVTDLLSLVIGVVKQLAVGALTGLDGLTAMQPNGEYLRWLNRPGRNAATYFAIASDYHPSPDSRLGRLARTHLINTAFLGAANDLMIPVEGVYAPNGATPFPITELLTLKDTRSVDHSHYLTSPDVLAQLMTWLQL
jgi:hypothetical protein